MTAVRAVTGPLAVVLLVLLGGCGSASEPRATASDTGATASGVPSPSPSAMPSTSPPAQPSPSPAPRRLTPEADDSHYSMAMGSTTALVVREPGADEPEVDGASVILIPVVNVTGSGVREWEVRAVDPGTSVITSTTPAYTITLTVDGP
ncbi:hypothetical protein [Ornithinibacter aureus]|uniref:hypothetical protein n=1 Tax=Ornithinibacter aureus TaxID=622664 RepID=UPI00135A2AE2|nr:hypothetical protein [Ornithinibacter aureus]